MIYENWIVKRIIDVAPSINAIYPMLGYNDYQDWLSIVDAWQIENPNCEYAGEFDHQSGSFIQQKLGLSNTEVLGWGGGTTHKVRHMLWKYVNENNGTLDAALLEEFRIDQGCPDTTSTP